MEANNAYLEGKKLKFGNKMNFYTHEAQQILLDDSLFDLPYFTGCQAGNGVCCIKANGDILPCVGHSDWEYPRKQLFYDLAK